jgi:hypothetical protein
METNAAKSSLARLPWLQKSGISPERLNDCATVTERRVECFSDNGVDWAGEQGMYGIFLSAAASLARSHPRKDPL